MDLQGCISISSGLQIMIFTNIVIKILTVFVLISVILTTYLRTEFFIIKTNLKYL